MNNAPPTAHMVRAAYRVVCIVGESGAPVVDVSETYWRGRADGLISPRDLERAAHRLVEVDLLYLKDSSYILAPSLAGVPDLDEDLGLSQLIIELMRSTDLSPSPTIESDTWTSVLGALSLPEGSADEIIASVRDFESDAIRAEVGALGEEIVVDAAREELRDFGAHALARRVRRVSLESDRFGFDVLAPRISGDPRKFEVKSSTQVGDSKFHAFISRNEYEVGIKSPDWFIVACKITSLEDRRGEIIGWCSARALVPAIPTDSAVSRWQSTSFELSLDALEPGLPQPL